MRLALEEGSRLNSRKVAHRVLVVCQHRRIIKPSKTVDSQQDRPKEPLNLSNSRRHPKMQFPRQMPRTRVSPALRQQIIQHIRTKTLRPRLSTRLEEALHSLSRNESISKHQRRKVHQQVSLATRQQLRLSNRMLEQTNHRFPLLVPQIRMPTRQASSKLNQSQKFQQRMRVGRV